MAMQQTFFCLSDDSSSTLMDNELFRSGFFYNIDHDNVQSVLLKEHELEMRQSAEVTSDRFERLLNYLDNEDLMVVHPPVTRKPISLSEYDDMINDNGESLLDTSVESDCEKSDAKDVIMTNDKEEESLEDTKVEPPTNKNVNETKEDFTQILSDWQEHINHMSQSDLDECMNMIDRELSNVPNTSLEGDGKQDYSFSCIFDEDMLKDLPDESSNVVKEDDKFADNEFQVTSNTTDNKIKLKFKRVKKEQVKDSDAPPSLPKSTSTSEKRKRTAEKSDGSRRGRRKIQKTVDTKPKQEEQEDCIDVETISDKVTVLEAPDLDSLLEQFEASENSNQSSGTCGRPTIPITASSVRSPNRQATRLATQNDQSAKSTPQTCSSDNRTEDSLKDVIQRLQKTEQRPAVSSSPTVPDNCNRASNNGVTQTSRVSPKQELAMVTGTTCASRLQSNSNVVHLDHDYCTSNRIVKRNTPPPTYLRTKAIKTCTTKSDHSKQSGQNNNMRQTTATQCRKNNVPATVTKMETKDINSTSAGKSTTRICQTEVTLKKSQASNNPSSTTKSTDSSTEQFQANKPPAYPLIRSKMAVSILQRDQSNRKELNLNNPPQAAATTPRMQQMVSVLKNPPTATQPSSLASKPKENIVTTVNSSNDPVQNIILQDAHDSAAAREETKKPSRKKLNLAEYRNRRDLNTSGSSPIQRTTLVYFNHAFTTTEPITDNDKLVWVERTFTAIPRSQAEIEEEKNRPKSTCDKGVQTYETVFKFPARSTDEVAAAEEIDRKETTLGAAQEKQCRKRQHSSSSQSSSNSESKRSNSTASNSRSDSGQRTRRRSLTDESRDGSRSRDRSRRRTISRRRSSVSSNNSSSSPPYSYKSGSGSGRSNSNSRSSSRSNRDRSRSRSPRRHYSSSNSSSRSDYDRQKWSHYRRNGDDRDRHHDRYRRRSPSDRHSYHRDRRSPYSYSRSYGQHQYNQEKQKQVEERRVVYVGGLSDGVTKNELHQRFRVFGPLEDVSIHLREKGNNYGFVTFVSKIHANNAVDHGNDDKSLPMYDINFGGRRVFCKSTYADLDDTAKSSPNYRSATEDRSFDSLLQEAKAAATLRKRKV